MESTTAKNCKSNITKEIDNITLPSSDIYKKFDEIIDELYLYRDKFYIDQGWKSEAERNLDVTKRVYSLVSEIEKADEGELGGRVRRLVLIGKTLNILFEKDIRTFETLTRAIKLEPSAYDAWNYLGEYYWKSKDFEMCRNCFERSLAIERNKRALRGMSIVLRQLMKIPTNSNIYKKSNEQQQSNESEERPSSAKTIHLMLEESIKYAKEAIQLDASDGMSWYTLANSCMAKFFSPFGGNDSTQSLKQAIQSFNLAIRDEKVAIYQSDIYYNKAMLSMYEEDWSDALSSLSRSINLDPHWIEVRESLCGVIVYLVQLNELLRYKAKLKPKRFQSLIDSIKPTDLGAYAKLVQSTSTTLFSLNEKIQLFETRIQDMGQGINLNKILTVKVIGVISANRISKNLSIVCYTCCVADAVGDCAALTIYNLAVGNGPVIGDSVVIPDPWCEHINVSYSLSENFKSPDVLDIIRTEISHSDDGSGIVLGRQKDDRFEIKFVSVRVENPTVLVVNGRKWNKEKLSSAFFVPKVITS